METDYLNDSKLFMDFQISLERLKLFPCPTCTAAFLIEKDLVQHICCQNINNNNSINYKNENDQNYINKAVKTEKKHEKYVCEECGKKFVLKSNLEAHVQIHSPLHKCECGIGYYQLKYLKAHQNLLGHIPSPILSSVPKKIIKKCKKYPFINNNPKRYKCTICPKAYTQKHNLTLHLDTHDNIKRFLCTVCNKKFASNASLKLHSYIHTGYKPYVCEFCSRMFNDPSARLRHVRIHKKDYKYVCEKCPMKFTDGGAYGIHRKRHDNIRSHFCKFCKKGFYVKSDLQSHLARMH